MSQQEPLLKTREAAIYLGISSRTLEAMRLRGSGPRYARVGSKCVRYRLCDLIKFVEDRLRMSTSEEVE